jgi:hypothetical protein
MRSLIEKIKRIVYWGWTLRDSHDFDFGYSEQALLFKLRRLQECMNTDSWHMNLLDLYAIKGTLDDEFPENTLENIRGHRALNLVIMLLERQQKSSFYGDFTGIYDFIQNYTYGDRDILNIAKKDAILIPREEYSKKLLTLHQQEDRMNQRDRRWAYSLIAKYGNHWWT